MRAFLEEPVSNARNSPTAAEVIARAVLKKARSGDVKAFEAIANRVEGKAPQTVKLSGEIQIGESRREWAEKKLNELMKPHKLSRAAAIKELRAIGAMRTLQYLAF